MKDPKKWMPQTRSHVFESMGDFVRWLDNNRTDKSRANRSTASDDFAGCPYNESVKRALGAGNPALGAMIERNLDAWDIDSLLTEGCSRWEPSRVGVMPIVPNVVAGIPETMLAQYVVHEAAKHPLTIMVDVGVSASVSAAEAARYGAAVAALVLTLQRVRPVELFVTDTLGDKGPKVTATVPIVRLGAAPFDPAQIAYALADVSFTRRLAFEYKWIFAPSAHIPWAWGLYNDLEERSARAAYLAGSELGDNFLYLSSIRTIDQKEIAANPRKWIQDKLALYAPSAIQDSNE